MFYRKESTFEPLCFSHTYMYQIASMCKYYTLFRTSFEQHTTTQTQSQIHSLQQSSSSLACDPQGVYTTKPYSICSHLHCSAGLCKLYCALLGGMPHVSQFLCLPFFRLLYCFCFIFLDEYFSLFYSNIQINVFIAHSPSLQW